MVLDQVSRDINQSFTSLLNAWDATGVGQIMVERVAASAAEDYGIVDLDGRLATPFSSFKIKGLIEKPSLSEAPSDLAIIGRYILPSIVLDFLESTKMGVGGEIQLTDALDALLQTDDLNAFLTDALTFDCGNKQGFLGANLALGMRDSDTRQYLISLLKNDLGFNLPLSGP